MTDDGEEEMYTIKKEESEKQIASQSIECYQVSRENSSQGRYRTLKESSDTIPNTTPEEVSCRQWKLSSAKRTHSPHGDQPKKKIVPSESQLCDAIPWKRIRTSTSMDSQESLLPLSSSSSSSSSLPPPPTRRTATSYDASTTHYLKSVFFSIYSKRDKLTKDQRREVQEQTGLKPRNITYWFSNHKRRFQTSLKVFKQTVRESGGRVKSYDDFLHWRSMHGLSSEVNEDEITPSSVERY
ncbi:hypothetical protein BDF14DRAFT_1527340 [Spinellus fusiger]|nr:hypothetical protein BDF14DRAFT_1527340 [Spinellus fusiger]